MAVAWFSSSVFSSYFISIAFHREGDLRVIRPFAYVREKDLRNFADKVSPFFSSQLVTIINLFFEIYRYISQ